MHLIYSTDNDGFNLAIAKWVMKRADMNKTLHPGEYYGIGVVNNSNDIIAGILYHDYAKMSNGGMIHLSFASDDPRWCRRGIIGSLLSYPFIQCGCHVVISYMKRKNVRVRKLAKGIGFREVGVINNWPYAEDIVLYELRIEKAERWLPKQFRQEAA